MVKTINQKKYRRDYFRFRTPDGIKSRLVVVTAGDRERTRLVEKAAKIAKENNWRLL